MSNISTLYFIILFILLTHFVPVSNTSHLRTHEQNRTHHRCIQWNWPRNRKSLCQEWLESGTHGAKPRKMEALACELEKTHGISARVIAADLSQPHSAQAIYDELRQTGVAINALVNNAGFGVHGEFAATDLQSELDMIAVNMTSLTELTKLFLPDMLKAKSGRILNIASTAGFQAGPLMAVYFATKAYVISFSEALFHELRGTGVTCTVLCPGATETEFAKRASMEDVLLFRGSVMSAAEVAQIGYDSMMRGKRLMIAGLMNRIMMGSARFTSRGMTARMARMLMERETKTDKDK